MIYAGRTYVDNTLLKSALSCSLQLVLRHVIHWNSREASSHLRAGSAMHESQATWNTAIVEGCNSDDARNLAMSRFLDEYEAYSKEWVALDDRLHDSNLYTILDEWYITHFGKLPWVVPDARLIEVGFAYPLDETGARIAFGRMDLIGRDARDGTWCVPDHKSTGRISIDWVDQWAIDSQVTHYFWGGLQHVPDLGGFYVNGIEFSRLPGSDRKCPTHGLPYAQCSRHHMKSQIVGPLKREPAMLDRWRADAIRAADKYAWYAEHYDPAKVGLTPDLSQVEMEGPFTGACRFCTFKDFCRLGRNERMLPAMYVQDEWKPYDPREFEGADPVGEIISG